MRGHLREIKKQLCSDLAGTNPFTFLHSPDFCAHLYLLTGPGLCQVRDCTGTDISRYKFFFGGGRRPAA